MSLALKVVIARNETVPGFSKNDIVNPNEMVTYTFSNNLVFQISSDNTTDLDMQYDNKMNNRQVSFIINNSNSLSIQIRSKTEFQSYGLAETPRGPSNTQAQWRYGYNCYYQVRFNTSIENFTIRFKKNANLGINGDNTHSIGQYDINKDSWELISTNEVTDPDTSEIYLESSISNVEANIDFYFTIYEEDSNFLPWIILIIILFAGFAGLVLLISKKDYFHYLRTRQTPIEKGAHRLTLDEVLENENRNKIIDLILREPGIHFNELLRRTELAAGNLVWHLDILETYKIIGKKRIGNFIAYFPYYQKNPISNLDLKLSKSKLTLEILKMIENEPGIWNSIITKRKKVDHKTIIYHVNKLLDLDLINTKKDGRKKKFYPNFESEYYSNSNGENP